MAKVTKWALFVRAFFIALIASSPSRVGSQDAAEQAAWKEAQQENTATAYHRYMSLYPSGEFVLDAIGSLDRLGAIDSPTRNVGSGAAAANQGRLY